MSTDDERDELSAIRRDYYRSVRATAEDFAKRLRAGEWSDLDEVSDAVREETDETYWSIYYHAAFRCLLASDNEANAWEEALDMGIGLAGRETLCTIAAIAHRLDVQELVIPDAETFFEERDEGEHSERALPGEEN